MALLRIFLNSDWTSVALTLIAVYISFYYYKYFSRKNKVPGPLPLPLIGNLLDAAKFGLNNAPEWAFALSQRYGEIYEIYLGSQKVVVISNAELMDKLMDPSTKTNFFNRYPANSNLKELGYNGNGVFFNHNFENWKFNRKFLSKSLMSPKFQAETLQQQQESFCDASQYLDFISDENSGGSAGPTKINLATTILNFNADLIIRMATGKKGGSLVNHLENTYSLENYTKTKKIKQNSGSNSVARELSIEFPKLTHEWGVDILYIFSLPKWLRHYVPGFSHFNTKCVKHAKSLNDILYGIIDEREKEIATLPKEADLESNLLTMLLTTNTERDPDRMIDVNGGFMGTLEKSEISRILLEVCHGSIEETSWVFSLATYYILKIPNVQRKFLKEIETILSFDYEHQITFEDLKKFKYLNAIIHETLRLFPPLPVMGRVNTTVDEVGGYKWEPDTLFWPFFQGLHMNEKHWSNPQEFNPERFLNTNNGSNFEDDLSSMFEKNSYLPFGGGIRKCPGRNMAMVNIKSNLISLFRKYKVELADKNAPPMTGFTGVYQFKELDVYLQPRNN
ncbi:4742_t:CDS:2 [Ambispora gerdemannii]|uniref:4742_t:CDS:1 n=1 Tax=Ambispora gerdemannii TaxID=144530 RepID=A0A9N9BUY9_9GLOM|nr:4742_t:CDS:2 [Ambispora gerdemannii]